MVSDEDGSHAIFFISSVMLFIFAELYSDKKEGIL